MINHLSFQIDNKYSIVVTSQPMTGLSDGLQYSYLVKMHLDTEDLPDPDYWEAGHTIKSSLEALKKSLPLPEFENLIEDIDTFIGWLK